MECSFCNYKNLYNIPLNDFTVKGSEPRKDIIVKLCDICFSTIARYACAYPERYKDVETMRLVVQCTHIIADGLHATPLV